MKGCSAPEKVHFPLLLTGHATLDLPFCLFLFMHNLGTLGHCPALLHLVTFIPGYCLCIEVVPLKLPFSFLASPACCHVVAAAEMTGRMTGQRLGWKHREGMMGAMEDRM